MALRITGVTQDEPINGLGDGDASPDAVAGAEPHRVSLRAERAGTGDGRVYTVAYAVSDGKGGQCTGVVKVGVPLTAGERAAPVESAPSFGAFAP